MKFNGHKNIGKGKFPRQDVYLKTPSLLNGNTFGNVAFPIQEIM